MAVSTSEVLAAGANHTGWHRKWLLLCAVLVWLYFLRFRVIGWVLSQMLTLALRWKSPRLQARAQIQYVTFRPLQFGHIEIRGASNDWRFVCTRITAVTHVLDFFRSFVQKKMVVLAIENVYADLHRLDEDLLRELVQHTDGVNAAAGSSTARQKPAKKSNPMGFLRFIDFQIRQMSVKIDVFDTRTHFRCCDVCVEIPDVFVAQNFLHLRVTASSLFVSSRHLEHDVRISAARRASKNGAAVEEGLRCELTKLNAVLDVRLTDQDVIGCSLEGDPDEPATFHVSTSFVESLLRKKMDLIRRDLSPLPKSIWAAEDLQSAGQSRSNSSSPFVFRVANLFTIVDITHAAPGGSVIPLQLSAQVSELEYAKGCNPKQGFDWLHAPADLSVSSRPEGGAHVSVVCKDVVLRSNSGSVHEVLSLERCHMEMHRDDSGRGFVKGKIATLELAVTSSLCELLHSLVMFPDVIDDCERETLQVMLEKAAHKQTRTAVTSRSKPPVHWSMSVDIDSWSLRAWLRSTSEGGAENLEAHGRQTSLRSVLPPKRSDLPMSHHVEFSEVDLKISPTHSILTGHKRSEGGFSVRFVGVTVSTTKLSTSATGIKSTEVKLTSSSVAVNEHSVGQYSSLPGVFFSNLSLHQTEVESTRLSITVTATDADVVTSHSRHKRIVKEVEEAVKILDHVRLMLTPPEPRGGVVNVPHVRNVSKVLNVNVMTTSSRLQLLDIESVSASVEFHFNEIKVAYQKSVGGVTSAVTCAFLKVLWDDCDPVVEVTGVHLKQTTESQPKSSLPVQVDSTARSGISLSQLQLRLRPQRRLLLLFLKLDELVNKQEDTNTDQKKKSSEQAVQLTCTKLAIDFLDDSSKDLLAARSINLDRLRIQATIVKAFELSDAVLRYLQMTRRHDCCRSRLADCIQTMGIEGSMGVDWIGVMSSGYSLLNIQSLLLNFALTDMETLGDQFAEETNAFSPTYVPPKALLFDVSASAKHCELKTSGETRAAARGIIPILQQTLDTSLDSASADEEKQPENWRLRYVGAFDCGIEHLYIAVPCEGDIFIGENRQHIEESSVEDRYVQVQADLLAFNCRQFQKLSVQHECLRIVLTDRDVEDGSAKTVVVRSVTEDDNLPLQLLLLPRTKVDAVIHWRERSSTVSCPLHEQFALSFDLVLQEKHAGATSQVPIASEALIALNWDYVYPLLVFLLTKDEDESDRAKIDTSEQNDTNAEPTRKLECIGIQWNMSLDLVQLAWWDSISQDAGILIVAHDLLSHGIVRLYEDSAVCEPTWILWESTVYLDLFRAYILREAQVKDDYISLACGVLPFEPSPSSRFFIETTGTSYRATHGSFGDEAPSLGANGPLFGDLGFSVVDKIHGQFNRVEYVFCIGTASRLHRMDSPSPSIDESLNNSSPPKSPRAWTQSVRAKLARLKRRTSSMDNMLLNDGSCPIQVDSMKLLWTLETRDSAFYMIAVTSDSLDVFIEASQHRREQHQAAAVRPLCQSDGKTASANSPDTSVAARRPDLDEAKSDLLRAGRQGSTRESLLELLHQGRLGKKDPTYQKDDRPSASAHTSSDGKASFGPEEMHLPKVIKNKKYTLDVHDAQINMLDDASRSTALIASKHIHLEVGFDESESTTIATLKFDCVTGHVAPIDVDISAGVLWYSYAKGATQLPTSPRTSSSSATLLKQVMEEFSLTTTYSQTLSTGATSVEADMSSLQLSTDRHQFYQLLNVLRHVLLAPPTVILRAKRQFRLRRDNPSEVSTLLADDIAVFPAAIPQAPPTPPAKKLHALLVEELRIRDTKMLGTNRNAQVMLKLISFRSAGCVYRLRTSPESSGGDHEFVEIRAEGITGSHMFFMTQSTKLVLNLQWMEITNLRPGPSSIAFDDPTAVLKAKLLVDQRYQSSSRVNLSNQRGMLTVRAESGPQTRVLGQKLRVLDVLEISVFPEIPNMIVIQLAADFYELVYKFFFEHLHASDHQETSHSDHGFFGKKGSSSCMTSSSPSHGAAVPPPSPMSKSRAYTSPASPSHLIAIRRKSIQSSNSMNSLTSESMLTASTASHSSAAVFSSVDVAADDDDSTSDGHELFYFKYVRIGNVRLRINCNGFFVNLNNFDLDLPPYVCQSKLCTWKKLLQKFESHLKWYVTKESASTGLSHFKNKLLKWTPTTSSASDKKEKLKKEEDTAMLNAQVLFGPYSGAQ